MAEISNDELVELHAGLSKLSVFLQNTLPKESLSSEAEFCRKECLTILERMNDFLKNPKNNNHKDNMLLNAGLSISSQSLDEANEFNGVSTEKIPRSGSLPDIYSSYQSENYEEWQVTTTLKGSYSSKKRHDLDEEININDLRELVIYHPVEENENSDGDDDANHDELTLNDSNTLKTSNHSPVNKRKSRKRDSAALFDISLEDLCEPDYAGFLREKHSEKLWWCVLIDQHLCIFPSQEQNEVAYDVIIMPCCQISLDDRLMRTPVFRLTQSDMTPWVFVASNNDELKEWMKVLTIAASSGKKTTSQGSNSDESQFCKSHQAPVMQSIVEEEEEMIEEEEDIEYTAQVQVNGHEDSFKNKDSIAVSCVHGAPQENGYDKELPEIPDLGELPQVPDEADGEQFGGDVYEAVADLTTKDNHSPGDECHDDGFATDEFDSGSSDGGDVSPNPQTQPVQQKAKKKKQFFHWLKKKGKKDKLFSSPKDGVALAGYAYKLNDTSKRWFLIREEKLHCYKAIKDDDPEITVDLKCSEIQAGEEEKGKLAIHVIRDNVTQFTLVAKSSKDWERWKKAFLIESGFIQLASPMELTSGVFEPEEEDEYAVPVVSPGLEVKLQSPQFEKSGLIIQSMDKQKKVEDPYTEIVPGTQVSNLKAVSPSVSQQELGPLPPIPPDIPERTQSVEEEAKDTNGFCAESDQIYEEVSSSVPHADKVIMWDGVNTVGSSSNPTSPTESNSKAVDRSSRGPVPAGLSDGSVNDGAITASSYLDNVSQPCSGRLYSSVGAWCPNVSDKQQYLQIDLGEVTKVCGVASQGRPGFIHQGGWFVKTYTIAYSKDGTNWTSYKEFGVAKVFQANNDPDTVVTNMLKMAVNAHYVKIKPQSWHNHIALRVEIYKGEAGSKLTAGIHKIAGSITKTAKKKSFDKLEGSTCPITESAGDTDVCYVGRQSPTENLVDGEEEGKQENREASVEDNEETNDEAANEEADGYLVIREATDEEKEVEMKVQKKIEALKRGQETTQTNGKLEMSQGILAKRSLYEGNKEGEAKAELKKRNGGTKKTEVVAENKESGAEKSENKGHIPRTRIDSDSYDPDKERQQLEKTEKAFLEYAKQMKNDAGTKEKKPSLVALSRLNFEDPGSVQKSKENTNVAAKTESLQKEKKELLKKLDGLKKRVSVAKDRKIFFSLSTSRSKATTDADAEFHESHCEVAKTKKRLLEIENEIKNLKVTELRNQKTPDRNALPSSIKTRGRKNSKECKLGSVEEAPPPEVEFSAVSNTEAELAQKGSVLSQIKVFEQMK
ncbi:uncharacterized protein [Montipora foliosa]|uniref:uncharacterized protein isoform X4 n=1 Tax=Montipora foliosa TaxID=591990 RepID=UPI0035F10EB1